MESNRYKYNNTTGTKTDGTKKKQVHFWEDGDVAESLKRFCVSRKIGDRQLKPEDVYRTMVRYLLSKRGFVFECECGVTEFKVDLTETKPFKRKLKGIETGLGAYRRAKTIFNERMKAGNI